MITFIYKCLMISNITPALCCAADFAASLALFVRYFRMSGALSGFLIIG